MTRVPACRFPWLPLIAAISTYTAADSKTAAALFPDQRSAAVHFLQPIFPDLDCEGVGVVEQGEVDEHFFQLFFSQDTDQSKTLSMREFLRYSREENRAKDIFLFKLIDKNADGQLSPREYREHVIFAIDAADADRDGELTEAEVYGDKLKKARRPKMPAYIAAGKNKASADKNAAASGKGNATNDMANKNDVPNNKIANEVAAKSTTNQSGRPADKAQ